MLVCNAAHYAGRYRLSPTAAPDDGLLDLYLLHAEGPLSLFLSLLMVARNDAHRCPHIARLRVRAIECQTAPALPVELDGDDFGDTPLSIRVAPAAIQILVPPGVSDAPVERAVLRDS
jgi:diacylglycerol kinase family enzyme